MIDTGLAPTVITFDPHPRVALGNQVELVSTLERRLELLGGDRGRRPTLVAAFTPELMRLEPEEFAETYLRAIGVEAVVAGEDFRFGTATSRATSPCCASSASRSSRSTRSSDASPRPPSAQPCARAGWTSQPRLLGRPFELDGVVVPGDQRGGELGYPTANIALDAQLLCPGHGVYAGFARGHRAALSIGTNPHYGGTERRIEPFLLDFEGDLYGQRLVVEVWDEAPRPGRVRERPGPDRPDRARRRGDARVRQARLTPTSTSWGASSSPGSPRWSVASSPASSRSRSHVVSGKTPQTWRSAITSRAPFTVSQDDHEVDVVRRLSGVGSVRPLEVPQPAPVLGVVAARVDAGSERRGGAVRREHDDAPDPHVLGRRADAGPQILLAGQVRDRVVDEDHVEATPEAQRPHVAGHVLALRVERAADLEHRRREVGQRAGESPLQVEGVVAAARAELEQGDRIRAGVERERLVPRGLDRVRRRAR